MRKMLRKALDWFKQLPEKFVNSLGVLNVDLCTKCVYCFVVAYRTIADMEVAEVFLKNLNFKKRLNMHMLGH